MSCALAIDYLANSILLPLFFYCGFFFLLNRRILPIQILQYLSWFMEKSAYFGIYMTSNRISKTASAPYMRYMYRRLFFTKASYSVLHLSEQIVSPKGIAFPHIWQWECWGIFSILYLNYGAIKFFAI